MARFKAYSSDSGTEEEEEKKPQDVSVPVKPRIRVPSEPVDEEGDSESEESEASDVSESSASEMQEDELESSPPRSGRKTKELNPNALVEDENGDMHFAHEVGVRVSPPSSSTSPVSRSRTGPRMDPTIIPWAQRVGVDAQKMHVMQTSLFRMPEEAAALKAMNQPSKQKGPAIRLDIDPKSQTANRKHGRDSDGDGMRYDSREV